MNFTVSFFEFCFEIQKNIHVQVFSWIPFSVGDLFYVTIGIYFIYLIAKLFQKHQKNRVLLKIIIFLNIFYFIYQLFWGMLYFQAPIAERLPKKKISLDTKKSLALEYLAKAKETRKRVTEDQRGVFIVKNIALIQEEILRQQKKLPPFIAHKETVENNAFKPSLYKNVMSFTGILGYYNPFTAEAQYNSALPSSYLPFTLAHESSHQLGFAREEEANFIGYLIGINSSNPELRYSTEYFTLKSLLNSIVSEDEPFVKNTLERYSEAMKRDRANEKKFVAEHQGLLNDFFGFTNNLFLKSNRQQGAITYSYFVDLLIRYNALENKK